MSSTAPDPTTRPPAHRLTTDRAAGLMATLGATLGVLAGIVDVAAGASIRDWVGNKLATTTLGLATIILSVAALTAALQWQRPGGRAGDRRLATALALLLPAGVCFTTIGRLWYLPGVLLLLAGTLVLGASTRAELGHAFSDEHWLNGLAALLGGNYVFLGADALPKPAGALGVLGGLAIWAALVAARDSHRVAHGLLGAGALPFALATWWSVVTPLMAILILTIGHGAICRRHVRLRGTRNTSLGPPTTEPTLLARSQR